MIERLSLENFKSIKEEHFDLERLTLLAGVNGMGKSSVIQSLLLLRQSHEKHLLPDVGVSLTGEYLSIGTGRDLLFSDAEDEYIKIEVYWVDAEFDGKFEYNENSDMQPIVYSEEISSGNPFYQSLFTSSFQYLSAERISPKSTFEVSEYAVNNRRSLGIMGEYTAHFLAQHGAKPVAIKAFQHQNSPSADLISNVNAWMSEITPGLKVVAKLIPEINRASLHYQFTSASEMSKQFRPENTGFGLTYVLPVVTAVLSARPGDLLLIENPESHLHPAGQTLVAKLIAIAASNEVQLVIETHSDHFLNGVRKSIKHELIKAEQVCAYFLSRDIDNEERSVDVEKITFDDGGQADNWPNGFFDEWDKSLNELVKGR